MPETDTPPAAAPSPATIFESIVRQRCVSAVYNRMAVILAPHIIYTRHGEIYVDAVTILRDGNPPKEQKMGAYKLTGLNELTLTDRPFFRSPLFIPSEAKYEGETLMAVEAN